MSEEFDPKYTTEATSEDTSQPTGETIINNDRRGGLVNWLRKDSIGMGILMKMTMCQMRLILLQPENISQTRFQILRSL